MPTVMHSIERMDGRAIYQRNRRHERSCETSAPLPCSSAQSFRCMIGPLQNPAPKLPPTGQTIDPRYGVCGETIRPAPPNLEPPKHHACFAGDPPVVPIESNESIHPAESRRNGCAAHISRAPHPQRCPTGTRRGRTSDHPRTAMIICKAFTLPCHAVCCENGRCNQKAAQRAPYILSQGPRNRPAAVLPPTPKRKLLSPGADGHPSQLAVANAVHQPTGGRNGRPLSSRLARTSQDLRICAANS
jgi:hypothetical protein